MTLVTLLRISQLYNGKPMGKLEKGNTAATYKLTELLQFEWYYIGLPIER